MSESLPAIDLSQYAIGDTGKIDLSNLKTAYNNPSQQALAHIRIFNDSGSTLLIRSDTGILQDYIPAGAWPTYSIDHSVQGIIFTVIGILPSPPIQLLMATYFAPAEEVPDTPQLGNSPVGIGGNVPLNATATAVANDGNAASTVFVESTPTGASSSQTIITADGSATFKNKVVVGTPGSGSAPFASNLTLAQNGGAIGAGCNILPDNPTGIAAGYAAFVWTGSGYQQVWVERSDGGLTVSSYLTWTNLGIFIKQASKFSGAASGNYSTGCSITVGVCLPMQSSVGSQTMGWDTPTGTGTVHITSGNGAGFIALALAT